MMLPNPNLPWPVPMAAVYIIAERESLRLKAYRCPAGVWTIGWGETDGVHPGDTCTKEQADKWLCDDLIDRTKAVKAMLKEPANDNQLGALVSLAYNIGLRSDAPRKRGLYHTEVLAAHNRGDFSAAARAFSLLNKALNKDTGKIEEFKGLTTRRAMEKALYLTPDASEPKEPMPQAVEPESTMTASPINKQSATVVATGAGWIATQLDTLQPLVEKGKTLLVDGLGLQPKTLLIMVGVLIVYVGVQIIYTRVKQRSGGWA